MAAERQSHKMISDMEAHTKQKYVIEFLLYIKIASTGIHQCLLCTDEDQTVHARTVRWWVVGISNSNSDSGSPLLVQVFMKAAHKTSSSLVKMIGNGGGNVVK